MLRKFFVVLFLATVSSQNISSRVRFDNYQVYRVIPHTMKQLQSLRDLHLSNIYLDFWTSPSGKGYPVDIMIPPDFKEDFLNFIKLENLDDAEVWIENVQDTIEEGNYLHREKSGSFDWDDYYLLETIYSWMDSLTKKYPGVATNVVGGKSYEGREIRGVKVSFGTGKRGVFLEGGIHAREWISPATVTYILNELLTNKDPSVRAIVTAYDWYVFPSINPDGYVYTHTTNRFWRKTRKPYGKCYGADPNRNWNYYWNHGGSSGDPCSPELYRGSSPFSEIETKTLSKYISTIGENLEAYISFHSFGQILLIPFGHSGQEVPENNAELFSIGKAAIANLTARHGTDFRIGNINPTMGVASGSSLDWVRGVYRKIRLAYAFELRDKGTHAFDLPKDQIIPTGEETFDGLVAMFQKIQ